MYVGKIVRIEKSKWTWIVPISFRRKTHFIISVANLEEENLVVSRIDPVISSTAAVKRIIVRVRSAAAVFLKRRRRLKSADLYARILREIGGIKHGFRARPAVLIKIKYLLGAGLGLCTKKYVRTSVLFRLFRHRRFRSDNTTYTISTHAAVCVYTPHSRYNKYIYICRLSR